jgi:hypothetical protein
LSHDAVTMREPSGLHDPKHRELHWQPLLLMGRSKQVGVTAIAVPPR